MENFKRKADNRISVKFNIRMLDCVTKYKLERYMPLHRETLEKLKYYVVHITDKRHDTTIFITCSKRCVAEHVKMMPKGIFTTYSETTFNDVCRFFKIASAKSTRQRTVANYSKKTKY